jgi:peptidoglycan hydrolase-like protein with peptidoglycan-binding domain
MGIIIGSARCDENGKCSGGMVGDQTGKEVSTQNFYVSSKGWYILRPKNIAHANAIASKMSQACNNDNIGYDQNNRLGIIKYGTNTTTKTECDCSSLVRQCIKEATGKDVGNFTTANEATILENSGLFIEKIAYTSSTPIYNGDILITKTKGHTAVVVSGNPRVDVTTTTASEYPIIKYGSTGTYVTKWQNFLLSQNYKTCEINSQKKTLKADGDFGAITKSITIRWQIAHGLVGDGFVGEKTWTKAGFIK